MRRWPFIDPSHTFNYRLPSTKAGMNVAEMVGNQRILERRGCGWFLYDATKTGTQKAHVIEARCKNELGY